MIFRAMRKEVPQVGFLETVPPQIVYPKLRLQDVSCQKSIKKPYILLLKQTFNQIFLEQRCGITVLVCPY